MEHCKRGDSTYLPQFIHIASAPVSENPNAQFTRRWVVRSVLRFQARTRISSAAATSNRSSRMSCRRRRGWNSSQKNSGGWLKSEFALLPSFSSRAMIYRPIMRFTFGLAAAVTAAAASLTTFSHAAASDKAVSLKRQDFTVAERPAFIISPTKEREGPTPWVLYAPTLGRGLPGGAEDWMFRQFVEAGIAIAGVDVGESYGSPEGRATYNALHKHLTEEHGFAPKACLLAQPGRADALLLGGGKPRESEVCCRNLSGLQSRQLSRHRAPVERMVSPPSN